MTLNIGVGDAVAQNFIAAGAHPRGQGGPKGLLEAVGIGDRVVSNRLALWAANGLVSLSCALVSGLLHLQGRGPLADPRAATVLGLGGVAGAALLYLAFIPPRWYLRRVTAAGPERSDLERCA